MIKCKSIILQNVNLKVYSNGLVEWQHGSTKLPYKTFGYTTVDGYKQIKIKGKRFYVHRIIALAFCPNPMSYPAVDHKNRKRDDNRVENLHWVSLRENANNTKANDICYKKYKCHVRDKEYHKRYAADYRNRFKVLNVILPNGKKSTRKIESEEVYELLRLISPKERFLKLMEIDDEY